MIRIHTVRSRAGYSSQLSFYFLDSIRSRIQEATFQKTIQQGLNQLAVAVADRLGYVVKPIY